MSFREDLRYFYKKFESDEHAVFVASAAAVKESIVEGSAVTGAPPLPVDTGNLRGSVQLEFDSPHSALVSTNTDYAPYIEDNVRGVTFRNGGPHGWKTTAAGWERIVADQARQLGVTR